MSDNRHSSPENRADVARVLIAIALLAWLSHWTDSDRAGAPLTAAADAAALGSPAR
jgi:hypothetical protein